MTLVLRPGTLVESTSSLILYKGLGIDVYDNYVKQKSLGIVLAVVNMSDDVWALVVGDRFMGWLTVPRGRDFSAYVRVVTP